MPSSLVPSPKLYNEILSSSHLPQMPNVFVVPPEEDDSPAWCFFDANEASPLESLFASPDISIYKSSMRFFQDEPQISNVRNPSAVSEQFRSRYTVDALFDDEDLEPDEEMHLDAITAPGFDNGIIEGNDSEVVEVVKIERRLPDVQGRCASPAPSKTSTSRSYKVPRMLKIFGKSSSDISPATRSTPTANIAIEAESSPTNPHRTSHIFMRFFHVRSTLRSDVSDFPSNPKPTRLSSLLSHLTRPHTHINERPTSTTSPTQPPSQSFSAIPPHRHVTSPVNPWPQCQGVSPSTPAVSEPSTGDTSFEMRLDSLHFEALSFDADKF